MAVRLHVVYAGRGDAMVVQDGAQLYLLDGGPQGLTYRQRSGAPYYRYYMSSVRAVASEMGRPLTSIRPDAVIVSHAHEDHFGGIQAIFQRFLSPTYATQPSGDRTLVFNGPLVTQVLDDLRMDTGEGTLEALLTGFSFRPATDPLQGPVFDAFTFASNDDVQFSVFQRTASTLLGRDWTVDTEVDNLASVLMFHEAAQMVFTGDSAGYLIAPFIDGFIRSCRDETLAVFKVPHHGSMRNSQRARAAATVQSRAWKERGLLCVLASPGDWDDIAMPEELQDEGAVAAAAQTLRALCAQRRVDPAALCAALRTAYHQTVQNIENRVNPPWVYAQGGVDTVGLWGALIPWLQSQVLASTSQAGAGGGTRGGKRRYDDWMASLESSWFNRLNDDAVLTDEYEARMATVQLRDFFAGFAAWNYVVSADGTYRHPATETLAAIATVATAQRRNVRIFVTDGSAVDLAGINALAPAGWSAYADIRYLARGARIVLDVTDPGNATNLALLDPLGTTASVASAFSLDALRAQFRNNRGAAIPDRTLGDDSYQLRVDGQALWLNLGAAGAISVGAAAQSLQIDDAWTLALAAPAELPYPSSFDDVRMRGTVVATGAQTTRLFTLVAAPRARGRFLLQLPPRPFAVTQWVSTDATSGFLTTDRSAAAVFAIARVTAGTAGLPALVPARRRRVVAARLAAGAAGAAGAPVTLRAFLQSLGEPVDQTLSVDAVLPQLVGPDNAAALGAGIALHVAERVLGWSADLDASTVTATEDEHGPLVTAAAIAIQLGTPLTFTIDDQQETIASASATLALSGDGPLTLEAAIETSSGIRVVDDASVASPSRTRPLDQYLHELGVDPASTANVTLGTLLTAIVGAQANAERLLMRAPSFVASAGIAQWLLDHAASAVEVDVNVAGDSEVRTARIVAQSPAGIQATIAGLALSIANVALVVTDARLPTMEVVLEATATIGTTQLAARAALTDERPALDLSLPATATLADLVALLPGAPALGGLTVPVAGAALSGLSFCAPGIVLAQPVEGGDAYELAEVYGTITYDGWGSILPAGWPAPVSSTLGVRVLSPLDASETQVALDVEFTFSSGGKTFTAGLAVDPLPDPDPSWAYTLSLRSDPAGEPVTVSEVLGAVGLSGPLGTLASALPAVGAVSSSLAVTVLALTLVVPASGPATWDGIELGLVLLDGWELVPDVLDLSTAAVNLAYVDGQWTGGASAAAILGGAHVVAAEAQLPTATSPGNASFRSSSPDLTVTALAQIAGLGDLSSVPVLGTLLDFGLTEAELQLVYEQGATAPSIAAAAFEVLAGDQALGVLGLSSLAIGAERLLLGQGAPSTSFWIEASWGEDKVASITYDGVHAQLTAELRMTGEQTIAGLLSQLLGTTVPNALLPVIGQFKVRDGSVVLDSADCSLQSFAVRLDPSASLQLGGAAVGELSVSYAAATEAAPASYVVEGTTTGAGTAAEIAIECQPSGTAGTVAATIASAPGTTGITLRGLLSLLGLTAPPVPTPDGAPQFLDLQLTAASATLTVGTELQLDTLQASVVTNGRLALLDSPAIVLEGIALQIDYDRSATPTTDGFVFGQVTIGSASVTVRYVSVEGQDQFEATVQPSPAPDFAALVAAGPYDPGYGLPSDLGLPAEIPMAQLTVVAQPGRFVDVSGYADTTSWPLGSDALGLQVTALGGHVRVQAPAQQGGTTSWSVALIGQLSFQGFVSSTVTFDWGPQRNSVLTATATAPASAIQLPAIATAIAPSSSWDAVVPQGTASIGFGDAAFLYFDLTAGTLALYGSLASLGTGALLSVARAGGRGWIFVIGLPQGFALGSLWSALAPVDAYVRIRSANASVLAYDGSVGDLEGDLQRVASYASAQGVPFDVPFANLPALASDLPPATPLPQGFAVFAGLDLANGTLSEALGRIGDASAPEPTVLVAAQVDRTTPANTAFSLTFKQFALLGGALTVDGTGTYRPSAPDALTADVTLTVVLTEGDTPYQFAGTLAVGERQTSFTLAGAGQPARIDQPFGLMFGIAIEAPQLAAQYSYPTGAPTTSSVQISGQVTLQIGGRGLSLDGLVAFVDGVPRVAAVSVTTSMSVLDLFADLISSGGGGGSWPSGYEVFELVDATIYYADLPQGEQQIAIDGTTYDGGYNVAADVRFFGQPFTVQVSLPQSRAGVIVSGSYAGEIDLGFVQLTSYTDPSTRTTTPGPTVSIDTTDAQGTTYAVSCGISVFKQPFLWTSFNYRPSQSEWDGTATYQGTLVGVANPSVSFTYSDADGLQIANWPMLPALGQLLDYAKALEQATAGSSCGQLVGLLFDKVIETDFDLGVAQAGPVTGQGALPLKLTGTYTVKVAGSTLFTLPLPEIDGSISAPQDFDLSGIADWIAQTIADNAVSIARSLLDDMVGDQRAFEIFMAEFAISYAGPALLASLLCEGATSTNVTEAAAEAVTETAAELTPSGGPLGAVLTPAATAMASTSLPDAAAACAAAAAALPALMAFVDQLVNLVEKAWDWLTGEQQGDKDKAEADGQRGQDAVDGARARIDGLLAMTGQPTVAFDSPTAVTVTWAADNRPAQAGIDYGGYAGFSYRVDVATDAQFTDIVSSQTTAGWSVSASASQLAGCNHAYVRVSACYQSFQGAPIVGSAFHAVPMAAPASVGEALAGDAVVVTVAAVSDATSYAAALLDAAHGGAQIAAQQLPAASGPSVQGTFTAADLPAGIAAGATLLASAAANGDLTTRTQSPFTSAPVADAVATSGPPSGLQASLDADGIAASWSALDGASAYAVRVVDAHGVPLSPQPTIALSGLGCTIDGAGLVDGATLGVEVRATTAQAIGLWAGPAQVTLHVLAAPTISLARFLQPESQLELAWLAVAGVTAYEIAITDGHGNPLSPAPTIALDDASATVSGAAIVVGGSYELRVRGTASGSVSSWSEPVALQATAVPGVGAVTLTYANGALAASWDASSGAATYLVDLSLAGSPVAQLQPSAPPASFGPSTQVALVPGGAYDVSIRALAGSSAGPPGTASASVPTLLALAQAGRKAAESALQAAGDLHALLPGVGPAQLFDTLFAAGYVPNDARAATEQTVTVTPQQMTAIVNALSDTGAMIELLLGENVDGPTIVALLAAIFSPVAVELAIELKRQSLPETGLAAAIASAFSMALIDATALVAAVWEQPWRLGGVLQGAVMPPVAAPRDLEAAYPTLSLVEAMASLVGGGYDVGQAELAQAIQSAFGSTGWADALAATTVDTTGCQLASLLHAGAVDRATATSYVAGCWPALTAEQVAAAIASAYGPS